MITAFSQIARPRPMLMLDAVSGCKKPLSPAAAGCIAPVSELPAKSLIFLTTPVFGHLPSRVTFDGAGLRGERGRMMP
jgi:hypothetical protein